MDYRRRISKLREMMEENEAVGALIAPGSNFYYLTGINPLGSLERLFLLLIPSEGEPAIIAPQLYENELSTWELGRLFLWHDGEDPYQLFRRVLEENFPKNGKLLVDDTMPVGTLLKAEFLENYKLNTLSLLISELRVIKSHEEIKLLKKAAEIVDKVFYTLLEEKIEGRSEKELAAWIEYLIKSLGADGISFEPIVASGPNGANPHHRPTDRKIKRGDVIVFDYGAKWKGYCSDITRTVVIGEPSEEVKSAYETVKEAQERAFQTVRGGIAAGDVDRAAREYIEKAGYGKYFTHRTGHGLGLDVHEEPYISPGNSTILREGMVFTIEPGIYLPGKFGIRIEDDVFVKKRGIRLTEAKRELMCI
ncbi:aminopeptidase P family protein [Thermococcus sp.]